METIPDCTEINEPVTKKLKLENNKLCNDDKTLSFPDGEGLDILHEVDFDGTLSTVTERYFTPYYRVDIQHPGDDICIWVHSNRICMISLAPSHTILKQNKVIEKVNFKVSDKLDRLQNSVSGKGKHGAQPLQNSSNLCFITCTDGSNYTIKCCMLGKLVEVNESLVDNPNLLRELPHKGGYIAIVLPSLKFFEEFKKSMLTEESYKSAIEERKSRCEE